MAMHLLQGGCDRLLVPAKGAAGVGEEVEEGSAYGGVFIGDIRLSGEEGRLKGWPSLVPWATWGLEVHLRQGEVTGGIQEMAGCG